MKIYLLSALCALTSFGLSAQNAECACCEESHKQFDFWLGDWIIKDTTGFIVGENRITKIEGGCVLKEKWTGTSGTTGISMNYFNDSDKSWNQLWLDNGGNQLQLKGRFREGRMILRSDVIRSKNSDYYNQITWSRNDDGTITQLWKVLNTSNKPLRTVFKGIYHRKK